ncbi:MAG: XdhC family protein [Pseudomonadales bacterium]
MQAVDIEVLRTLRDWLSSGQPGWLATVVATWGSSPRPVGSVFACNKAGSIVGSLSGGCVEDDLLEKLQAGQLAADKPQFFRYGITAEETERLGLPCGGQLDIVVEPHGPTPASIAHFTLLAERLEARQLVSRSVSTTTGLVEATPTDSWETLLWDADGGSLHHTLGPRLQLFIIGAGMVSQYLAHMALSLDFDITVCDPREHLMNDFPIAGIRRVTDMPDDAVRQYAHDEASAIVALTHDPRIDDMGLMEALKTRAFYVGAMGSTRTSASRRTRLLDLDVTEAELDRLHAPIGLPIGSHTPPEIAIAILAEITAVRNGRLGEASAYLAAASAG